jgi:parallel beta-helix repeat protein
VHQSFTISSQFCGKEYQYRELILQGKGWYGLGKLKQPSKDSLLRNRNAEQKQEDRMAKKIKLNVMISGLLILLLPLAVEAAVFVNCGTGQKIQAAVEDAQPGAVIVVRGKCSENVTIRKPITITGPAVGTAPTIQAKNASKNTFDIEAPSVTLHKLTIEGGYYGVEVHSGASALISDNTIQNAAYNGINLTNSSATIVNNTIQNNLVDGIALVGSAAARIGYFFVTDTSPSPNTIQNNGKAGIRVGDSSSASIVGNTISNNTADSGILVEGVSHATIADNTINGNINGVTVQENSGVNLGGNGTGVTIFDKPNSTTTANTNYGISCSLGGYGNGYLGTLNGSNGADGLSNDDSCLDNLK